MLQEAGIKPEQRVWATMPPPHFNYCSGVLRQEQIVVAYEGHTEWKCLSAEQNQNWYSYPKNWNRTVSEFM